MKSSLLNNSLKRRILKKKIISFDIFDTLIKRNCLNPSDIFNFVEIRYNKNNNSKITNFKEKRKNASILAKKKYNLEEVTIDQIYDCFDKKYDINLLKELEIQAEFDFCVANKDVKPIYDYAVANKKRIICVSDMYLDAKILKKLLKNCGYDIDEVYVSCEYNKKKSTKKLFKELLNQNKFSNSEIIHIGDAEKSDFLYPKLLGISTYLVRSKNSNIFLNNKNINLNEINNNIVFSLSNNSLKEDIYYGFGYEVVGPVCLYFCLWLNRICKNGNQKLLFCARDMKMLHEMYNILFPQCSLNSNYFYVSRRSLRLPYLYVFNSYESIINTLADHKLKITDILDNFNLLDNTIIKKMNDFKIDKEKYFDKKSISNNENDFYRLYDSILNDYINKIGKKEFNNFNNYLKEMNVNDFYLIDMGWKGTTQKMLMNLYPKKIIKGLYFGVEKQSKYKEINEDSAYGYLFYKGNENINDVQLKIYSSEVLFEKVFAAQHQSTIKYDNKYPFYVLDKKEINEDNKITTLQNGALKFIKDVKIYIDYLNELDKFEYINILLNNMIYPNLKFANFFGDIINDNMYRRKMAAPRSITYYIVHPKVFKKDLGESGWKIGFMKRLFKIKLPYYNIYKMAYSLKKKGK